MCFSSHHFVIMPYSFWSKTIANITLPLFLAWRLLRSKQHSGLISLTSWFSMIGIMLGVATLIVVMSIMNGFRAELIERILGVSSHIQIISRQGYLSRQDLSRFNNLPNLVSIDGVNELQAVTMVGNRASALLIKSIDGNDLRKRPAFKNALVAGIKWQEFNNANGVVIGVGLSSDYGFGLGDNITLVSPFLKKTAYGDIPQPVTFPIVGMFQLGMNEYDHAIIFMPPTLASGFMRIPANKVQKFELLIDNPDASDDFLKNLKPKLKSYERAFDWQANNAALVSSLKVESNVMFIILTLIILVAAFNVISGQTMLVREKHSTIAILRAHGADRRLILWVFLLTGSALGIIGTGLGLASGLLIAQNAETIRQLLQQLTGSPIFPAEVYYLTQLPSKIIPTDVIGIVSMALVISLLSAYFPARRAAKLEPQEILRHD